MQLPIVISGVVAGSFGWCSVPPPRTTVPAPAPAAERRAEPVEEIKTSEDVIVANVINWGASNTSIKTVGRDRETGAVKKMPMDAFKFIMNGMAKISDRVITNV